MASDTARRRATSAGFSKSRASMAPATKPPTCAHTATPPEISRRSGDSSGSQLTTWLPNQRISTSQAGKCSRKNGGMKVRTRTRG